MLQFFDSCACLEQQQSKRLYCHEDNTSIYLHSLICIQKRLRLQVWNTNKVTAVVGVFHLQGSSWDRTCRANVTHQKYPQPLTTIVHPTDIPNFPEPAFPAASPHAFVVDPTISKAGVSILEPVAQSADSTLMRDSSDHATALSTSAACLAAGPVAPTAAFAGISAAAICSQQKTSSINFAAFSFSTRTLTLLDCTGKLPVRLSSGGSDVITLARVVTCLGVSFAPIGFVEMMNGGAGILSCRCDVSDVKDTAIPNLGLTGKGGVYGLQFCRSDAALAERQDQVCSSMGESASSTESGGTSAGVLQTAAVETPGSGARKVRFNLALRGSGLFLMYSSMTPTHVVVNLQEQEFGYDALTGKLSMQVPVEAAQASCCVDVVYTI